MSTLTVDQIDQSLATLTLRDQLFLMERLARSIRQNTLESTQFEDALEAMAQDPAIQRELATIDHEFLITELDGLDDQAW